MEINSSTSHSESRQTLTPLWLFLIAVLTIESALRFLPEGYMTRTLIHRTEEIRYLPAAPIQLMGDSLSAGVQIATIEHFFNNPAVPLSNYALPGTSPMFSYFILRRQIAAGQAPKLIVYGPHRATWREPFLDRFLGRAATPREALELLRGPVTLTDWVYGALCRLSYTLRYREDLYLAITQGDIGFFQTWQKPVASVQNTRAKVTEHLQKPPLPGPSTLVPSLLPPSLVKPLQIHPYNEYYFHKFCELAAKHNIRILWITIPEPEMIRREFDPRKREAEYAPFVERALARHPNVAARLHMSSNYPDNHFADPWHFNRYGAWAYSEEFAGKLNAWLKANPLETVSQQ